MNKKIFYILVAVAVVVALSLWLLLTRTPVSNAPTTGTQEGNAVSDDTTGAINQDLNSIKVENPDFQSIDSGINSL